MYEFKIYIVGGSKSSIKAMKAVENLQKFFKGKLQNKYTFKVIDVLENPQLAREDGVFATPAMVKTHPLPVKQMFEDLSDEDKELVMWYLQELVQVTPLIFDTR